MGNYAYVCMYAHFLFSKYFERCFFHVPGKTNDREDEYGSAIMLFYVFIFSVDFLISLLTK